jgi:hypothetical protein
MGVPSKYGRSNNGVLVADGDSVAMGSLEADGVKLRKGVKGVGETSVDPEELIVVDPQPALKNPAVTTHIHTEIRCGNIRRPSRLFFSEIAVWLKW